MTVLPPSSRPAVALPRQHDGVAWPTAIWPEGPPPSGLAAQLVTLLDEAFPTTGADAAEHERRRSSSFGQSLAFVAIHQGRLVAERYGPTAGPTERLISWSMAKSMTHALIGILVGEGRLSLDEPAPVSAWSGSRDPRSQITVDHLLRMVPGTVFNEDYVDETTSHCIEMLFGSGRSDMAAYTSALPLEAQPGTRFNYASGITVVLCKIMADIVGSGSRFEAWMHDALLDPLGIEADLTFDDVGTWVGSSFLNTTARDFAKFGLLYLRDGVWEDRRLLPEGWVDYGRTIRAIDEDGGRYGAQWWIWPQDDEVFYASGYETQRIIVDPRRDLIIVRLGKTPTGLAPNVDAWLDRVRTLFPSH